MNQINMFKASVITLLSFLLLHTVAAGAQVRLSDLDERNGVYFERETGHPYTGPATDTGDVSGHLQNGLQEGEWVRTFPSGQPAFMTRYEKGTVLEMKVWHQNGRLSSIWPHRNGLRHGVMQSWDRNGILREERSFVDGQTTGPYRLWDHTGALLYTAEYDNRQIDGPAIWYYADGSKRWETTYSDGVRVGTWTQYAPDGRIQMQSQWNHGLLVSRMDNPHGRH